MRFSTAIVAIAVGAVSAYEYNAEYPAPAETTVYSTEYVTVTSCAASVTNCPADSTVVYSTSYPATSTAEAVYPGTTSTAEAVYPGTSSAPVVPYPNKYSNSSSVVVPVYPGTSTKGEYPGYPVASSSAEVPVYPGKPHGTGSVAPYPPVYLTTSTAAPACPTYSVKTVVEDYTTVLQTTKYETVAVPCPTAVPSGYPVPSGNGSSTYPAPPPVYTAGASTMGASVILAAAAGLAAFLL